MQSNFRHALLHDTRHKVSADAKPFVDLLYPPDNQGYLTLCGRLIRPINYKDYQIASKAGFLVCEECERRANGTNV